MADRLTEIEAHKLSHDHDMWHERAKAAEARVHELEAALEKIERTPLRGSAGMANVRDIARRALAASPEERGGWHGSAAGGAEGDTET